MKVAAKGDGKRVQGSSRSGLSRRSRLSGRSRTRVEIPAAHTAASTKSTRPLCPLTWPHSRTYITCILYVIIHLVPLWANHPKSPPTARGLIPPHGGYRKLKSFQMAELCFDVTARFCKRYVDRRSRTYDQMVQAARSGTQNIVEGSAASGTSKRTEMKLTDTARFSLEELRRDYQDYLRQRGLKEWSYREPLRQELIDARCASAEEVANWVRRLPRTSRPTFNRPTFRPDDRRQRRGFL